MARWFTRDVSAHNTKNRKESSVLKRTWMAPVVFTPPQPAGNYTPGMNYINYLQVHTPEAGSGDPRVKGQRQVMKSGRTTTIVG